MSEHGAEAKRKFPWPTHSQHSIKKARCNAAVEMTKNAEISSPLRRQRVPPLSVNTPTSSSSQKKEPFVDYLTDRGDSLVRNSSLETNSVSSIHGLNLNQSNNGNRNSQRHSLSSSNPDSGLCSLDLSDISLNGNSRTDISRVRSNEEIHRAKSYYRRAKTQVTD
jgi:hypothetical protein